jgi:phosphoserine phosphatase
MRYKLVCFDLDGTIIDDTIFIWSTIHKALGTDKHEKRMIKKYYEKKITYDEWAKTDIALWKEAGADRQRLMEIIKPLKLMPGALDTLRQLKKAGLKLAIISGSLDIALEYVLPTYKDFFDDVLINKLYFNSDGSIKDLEATKFDVEHKATGMKEICKREKIDLKECVFIGDNHNDTHIAEIAGFSIAFNCKSELLAEISDVVIKKKDLREVLPFILKDDK